MHSETFKLSYCVNMLIIVICVNLLLIIAFHSLTVMVFEVTFSDPSCQILLTNIE